MNQYNDLLFVDSEDMDLKRDNANINTDAPMGIMLKLGTEGAKNYLNHYVLPEKFKEMHMKHIEHLHELHRGLAGWPAMEKLGEPINIGCTFYA